MTLKDLVVEPRGGTSVVLDMTIKDLVKESKLDTLNVEESHKDTLDPDMSLKDLACDSVGNHRKGVIPFTDLMCELSNNQMVCEKLTEPKNSKGKHPHKGEPIESSTDPRGFGTLMEPNTLDKKYLTGNFLGKMVPKTGRSRAGFERLMEFGESESSDEEVNFRNHKKVVGLKPPRQLNNNRKFGTVIQPANASRFDNVYHRVYEHQKQVVEIDNENWFKNFVVVERVQKKLSL
jgi:galactitol-specific phosphotransferase system IIB component